MSEKGDSWEIEQAGRKDVLQEQSKGREGKDVPVLLKWWGFREPKTEQERWGEIS